MAVAPSPTSLEPSKRTISFAYVDAGTKSGRIWRHTAERPNFRCDPKNEIDHTSFGCYPSVLEGEMVPVSFLEFGREGIKYLDVWQKVRKRLKRPTKFRRIDYLNKFNVLLVCYDLWFGGKATSLLRALRAGGYKGKILGAANFNLGRIREEWRKEAWYRDYLAFTNLCDIYFSLNAVGMDYHRLVTKVPVVYMPQPYPFDYAHAYFRPRAEKKRQIFIAGDTSRLDIVPTCLVAKEIQKRLPDVEIAAVGSMIKNRAPLEGACVNWLPSLSWEQYLEKIAESMVVLNLDVWWTKGRVPTDAAAVGTPCVGSNADSQMELFPDLVCDDITGIAKAIEVSVRLLSDSAFYGEVAEKALSICRRYDYPHTRRRVVSLLAALEKGTTERWRWDEQDAAAGHE